METKIRDLKRGQIISLQDNLRGKILNVTEKSHMPPIFQDSYGREGRSVFWENIDGPHAGTQGVERVHADTTIMVLEDVTA